MYGKLLSVTGLPNEYSMHPLNQSLLDNFDNFKKKYQKVPVQEYPNAVLRSIPEPIVSVRISTYQHSDFIRECLESILSQKTSFPFEILIGEDESSDGTQEICIEYASRYPEIIRLFLHSRKNNIYTNDQPTARFQGRYTSFFQRGKYYAFCEGDDYWLDPLKLQKQVDFLESHPDYVMCFGNAWNLTREGVRRDYLREHFRVKVKDTYTEPDLIETNFIPSASIVHRSFPSLDNFFHPSYPIAPAGDWIRNVRLAQFGKLRLINEFFSVRRVHNGGIISGKSREEVLQIRIGCYQAIDGLTEGRYRTQIQSYINKHEQEIQKVCAVKRPVPSPTSIAKKQNITRTEEGTKNMEINQKFLEPKLSPDFMDLYIVRSSILNAIRQTLPRFRGTLLDVGCGIMPYRSLLTAPPSRIEKYIGMDIESDTYQADVDIRWDGKTIPLDSDSVQTAMATEVLEHCPEPTDVLTEIRRVLEPGGFLFFTVPYIWPIHDAPWDFYRYTSFALKKHFTEAGFSSLDLKSLGGWNASLAQMIGLWVKRAPMDDNMRQQYSEKLFPLFESLIETDKEVDPYANRTMTTGWWGLAHK